MAYTTIDDPSKYFQTKLYTAADTYTFDGNSDMQPDWMWIKERNGTNEHNLFDSVRGTTKRLESSTTAAEQTSSTTLTAFGSDGFTVGNNGGTGQNGGNYVGWGWKAGTSFTNDASSTSIGSIDSAGSVSTDAGFSIVSYTGTGANATIAHGLGAKPQVIFTKSRDTAQNWLVQHKYSIGSDGWTDSLVLNLTNTADDDASYWNDTEPTSTVFSVGSSALSNKSSDSLIAYLFAEKQGYSKFGSYKGNGNANGTFVYTGFKPAWVMTKISSATGQWGIADNKRGVAPSGEFLFADSSGATNDAPNNFDFTAQGFKPRADYAAMNTSGATYIFMAFAEQPFVTSTGVPATAR